MAIYLITFDLEEEDYRNDILTEIKVTWGGKMATESSYVVVSDQSSIALYQRLTQLAHGKIKVFVFTTTWFVGKGKSQTVGELKAIFGIQ